MGWKDKLTTGTGASNVALRTALRPGEELRGAFLATRRTGLVPKSIGVGVTADRLILAPVSGGKDAVTSIERSDIVSSSSKGLGVDWRTLSGSNVAKVTLETRTHGEVKLSVLDDDLPGVVAAGGSSSGVKALQEFLASVG